MVLRFYSLWPWMLKVSRRGITHGFCSFANPPLQPAFRGEAKATALAVGAHGLTQPPLPELPSNSWRIILSGSSSFAAFKESAPEGGPCQAKGQSYSGWVHPPRASRKSGSLGFVGSKYISGPYSQQHGQHFKAGSHCGLPLNPPFFPVEGTGDHRGKVACSGPMFLRGRAGT